MSSLPMSSETSTEILLTDTLLTFMKSVASPMILISAPLAASSLAEVGTIVAPHCLTMLLLAIPLVQPESGVAAMLRLWRDARLPTLHGSKGVSLEGDWKTAGLDNPVLPLLIGVVTLHLCLTTFAFAGLGDREVSLEDGCEFVGEGFGVLPGFPALPRFLASLGLWLPPSPLGGLGFPLLDCLVALLLNFGCWESQ